MKGIGQLHTQYMNRTYGRTGSLWEGRFRSCLVQTEDYLLACYRYIEMNPVRAKLVSHHGIPLVELSGECRRKRKRARHAA